MTTITYYFSPLSPFSYLAGTRLEDLAEEFSATIAYRPFDIMALFAKTGGVPPKQRHPSRQAYRLAELKRLSVLNDLPITLAPRHWPTDPVPASLAIIAAATSPESRGSTGALVHDLMARCWAREQDIADSNVINDCLTTAGFDPAAVLPAGDAAAAAYARNTESALADGVFGAPSYILDGHLFWGQDRLGHLRAMLEGRFSE
ncbi:MAG: 2-hydroxychromene-2-carboxylate isomerase [Rhodobacteraceae bacterium]|nr:2-hydroxychromene-2-carboxylate isomerase [Paracoccaceae bacterium]